MADVAATHGVPVREALRRLRQAGAAGLTARGPVDQRFVESAFGAPSAAPAASAGEPSLVAAPAAAPQQEQPEAEPGQPAPQSEEPAPAAPQPEQPAPQLEEPPPEPAPAAQPAPPGPPAKKPKQQPARARPKKGGKSSNGAQAKRPERRPAPARPKKEAPRPAERARAKKPTPHAAPPARRPAAPVAAASAARPAPTQPASPRGLQRVSLEIERHRLQRARDAQLRDLSELTVELRRAGEPRDDLLEKRFAAAAATDDRLRALEERLGAPPGGACSACGAQFAHTRFCLECGERLQPEAARAERMSKPMAAAAVVAIAVAWLLGGIRGGDSPSRPASAASVRAIAPAQAQAPVRRPAGPVYRHLVAAAKGGGVSVYAHRGATVARQRLASPNLDGAQLVFLVKSIQGGWAHVLLPSRPNGSTGWIKLSAVTLTGHSFHLVVDLGKHRLTAWNGRKMLMRTPVGVGRAVTPTPAGLYYITELLKQPEASGSYGPWAFGLSAHSNVLHEFAGRDGILGIHGTDYPQGVGTDVSHGCIRLSNAAISRLARTLPVGTPVRIVTAT